MTEKRWDEMTMQELAATARLLKLLQSVNPQPHTARKLAEISREVSVRAALQWAQ